MDDDDSNGSGLRGMIPPRRRVDLYFDCLPSTVVLDCRECWDTSCDSFLGMVLVTNFADEQIMLMSSLSFCDLYPLPCIRLQERYY